MRLRILTAAAAAAALLVPVTGASAADPVGEKLQTVAGTVAVPNPTKAAANVTRHGRTLGFVGAQSNGVVSWWFKVDPNTWGGEFVLSSPTAGADFDALFYSDPGTIADASTTTAEFLGASGDGERGIIPAGTTFVLLYPAGAPNAAFTYTGYAPATVGIGSGSLDITVVNGATVRWVNNTTDYTYVRSARFDSGSGTGQGIPVGGTFEALMDEPGTYTYSTSVGTGTITVAG